MRNVKCKMLLVFMFCLFLQMMPHSAFAHKVNVFAYVEGDTVYTESYFPDGRKVTDGVIKVYNTKGKMLLEGTTDKNGQFSFKIPTRDDLKIVLEASLGHRNTYTLSASEMPDTIEKTQSPSLPKQDEKLPLKDIISGIGYIFGITGIIMFFLNRKRKDAST